jgi:hypothetical protein
MKSDHPVTNAGELMAQAGVAAHYGACSVLQSAMFFINDRGERVQACRRIRRSHQ